MTPAPSLPSARGVAGPTGTSQPTRTAVVTASSQNGRYPTAVTIKRPQQVFQCTEESGFFTSCLQRVFARDGPGAVRNAIEFGAGNGSPVLDALLQVAPKFKGVVHGFELSAPAAALAQQRAQALGLDTQYKVQHGCFFKGVDGLVSTCEWLVANPPYLPAPDTDILMPELWGGEDGADLTCRLLTLGLPNAMLLVSSYSNPERVLAVARDQGYKATDFLVTPLPFGTYSSEPKVKNWIRHMKSRGLAYYSERPGAPQQDCYLLAGVVFQRGPEASGAVDISSVLLRTLTAL